MLVFLGHSLRPTLAPLAGDKDSDLFEFLFVCCSYSLRVGFAAYYYSWHFMQLSLELLGLRINILSPGIFYPNRRDVDNLALQRTLRKLASTCLSTHCSKRYH